MIYIIFTCIYNKINRAHARYVFEKYQFNLIDLIERLFSNPF